MNSTIYNDDNDTFTTLTSDNEAVKHIKIEADLMNIRDDSLKYVCMTVFGVFSVYAIATTIMKVYR